MEFVKFSKNVPHENAFQKDLKKQVRQYFMDKNLSTKAGLEMHLKSIFFLGLYLIPFLILFIVPTSLFSGLFISIIMGIGVAGVGMNIMHDACHDAYSRKKWMNELLAGSLYLLGSNIVNWKIQHNILHHTFTNVRGIDEDIDDKGPIRLSFSSPLKPHHRFQHIYAFFFYGFMTLFMFGNDFNRLFKYNKAGLLKGQTKNVKTEIVKMLIRKTIYIGIIVGLPIWLTEYSVWQILLGFFIMHWTASIILSLIFQMAHIVDGAEQRPQTNNIDHHWSVHQLKTTSDFARNNKLLDWFIGGLNYQIEHHLFPNICHTHYKHIASIVEETARAYGFNYNLKLSFNEALTSHLNQLRLLGNNTNLRES